MKKSISIISFLLSLLITACQTMPSREFTELKLGMDKDQVLATMGSPNRADRREGIDRWAYVFYDKGLRQDKEVQFIDGIATYIGDRFEPTPEKSWQAEEKRKGELEERIIAENEIKKTERKKSQVDYNNFEKEAHLKDKIHYMPDFKPID